MRTHVEPLNYLAINLLENLGNTQPTEFEIEIVESFLLKTIFSWQSNVSSQTQYRTVYHKLAPTSK